MGYVDKDYVPDSIRIKLMKLKNKRFSSAIRTEAKKMGWSEAYLTVVIIRSCTTNDQAFDFMAHKVLQELNFKYS